MSESLRLNWDVFVQCVDCGVAFQVERPLPSTERLENGQRIIVVNVPNECPECKNIRRVK